ncbi:MAG: molybdopterin-dependent oxidoreductase, partial [Terriglobia bacterium]
EIQLLPDKSLENNYSGNVIDICPVGALTDRHFRFQCRVWYLNKTNSVCNGCSRGCNITIETNAERPHHAEGRRVMRLKPRYNPEVNQWWICDIGRYGFEFIDSPSRLAGCLEKQETLQRPIEWNEAIQRVSEKLSTALQHGGADSVVIVASPQLTNEDFFLMRRLFVEELGISQIDYKVPEPHLASGDNMLLQADRHPNTWGAQVILQTGKGFDLPQIMNSPQDKNGTLLCLFEQDLVGKLGEEAGKRFLSGFEYVIYVGHSENETSMLADLILSSATYAEVDGTFTNFEGRVQRIRQAVEPLGDSLPTWQIVARLAESMGKPFPMKTSEEIFNALADRVSEFKNLSYAKVSDRGAKIGEPALSKES